jgi:hypothetical protein
MRTSNLLFLCAAAALPLGAQVTALGQSCSGAQVRMISKLEPPAKTTDPAIRSQLEREVHGNAVMGGGGRFHRVWQDAEQKVYQGYDLSLEKGSSAQTCLLRILPLSFTPQQISTIETWTLQPLPKYPVIPEVRVGDTVAIDILVNPATGQKLVDYLTLERAGPVAPPHPRDFTLADTDLSFYEPRLSIDGKLVQASVSAGSISGPTFWFYLEGHGRYVISLFPKPELRFQQAGAVHEGVLTFRDGAEEYRIECERRIAPGEGHYNIYVRHDPAWRPEGSGPSEPFFIGSFPLDQLKGK